jgi:hypothetical protein
MNAVPRPTEPLFAITLSRHGSERHHLEACVRRHERSAAFRTSHCAAAITCLRMPLCSALSMLLYRSCTVCASTARTSRGLQALTAPAFSG